MMMYFSVQHQFLVHMPDSFRTCCREIQIFSETTSLDGAVWRQLKLMQREHLLCKVVDRSSALGIGPGERRTCPSLQKRAVQFRH